MSRTNRIVLGALGFVLVVATGFAQDQTKTQAPATPAVAATPAANPADVASVDAIMAAVYDVISGLAGQKRDWDRMRSLFYTGARLIPTAPKKEGGGFRVTSYSVQDYIDRASPYFEKKGFSEREIARRTEKWGNIVQAFSTYESRHDAKDAAPLCARHQQLSTIFRRNALVGGHDLLARRNATESVAGRITPAVALI
jgi:hypothetical protein